MLGAFRSSLVNLGGLVRKNPWKMSQTRKANVRKRLQEVDNVIKTLTESGLHCRALDIAKKQPTESQMLPKDKYFVFSKKHPGYRKSVHKIPHFTKVDVSRKPPAGF